MGLVLSRSISARMACSIIAFPGKSRDSLNTIRTFLGVPLSLLRGASWAKAAKAREKTTNHPASQKARAGCRPQRQKKWMSQCNGLSD